jgi:epoxyqueuosine reductase QueG
MLRLGAVVTSAALAGDPVVEEDPCPEGCSACREACPAGAFGDGGFRKMACLSHTIRHGIYPLALKDEVGRKNIEMIINSAGYNYWLKCDECLKVCPRNRRNG